MIKININEDQELSKDNVLLKGKYTRVIKIFGIGLWDKTITVGNDISDKTLDFRSKTPGFGKRN